MPDPLVDYATAADGFAAVLAAADDLSGSSPCPEWTARDVVDHVLGGARHFTELFGGPVTPTDGDDLPSRYATARADLVAAISAPGAAERLVPSPIGGELPAVVLFGIYTSDTLLHTWDLARATGQDVELDPELLERSWRNVVELDEVLRAPGLFGPKVEVPDDEPTSVQALAFFGRDAR